MRFHQKILFAGGLIVLIFTSIVLLNNLDNINTKITEELESDTKKDFYDEIMSLPSDPEWRARAKKYLEQTGGYEPPQNSLTREQKKQYVISLIQSLSKSDIRALNDFLRYVDGGYYFNTTEHVDYPSNPEALRYVQLHIHEVIDLLSEK